MTTCVKIILVWVIGANQLPLPNTINMVKQSERLYRQHGYCVKVERIVKVRDFTSTLNHVDQRGVRFAKWQAWRWRRNYPYRIVHFQLPPMTQLGIQRWMAGSSSGICRPGNGSSWGTGQLVNHEGKNRALHTKIIFLHEIGHLLGASHNDDCSGNCSLMHPAAAAYAYDGMNFKVKDLYGINKCLGGYGYFR